MIQRIDWSVMQYTMNCSYPYYSIHIVICVYVIKHAGSTAKKAGRRRISFRQQPGDSNNEPDDSQHDEEDEVEAPGAAEPILSADHIEEDKGPSASAPSSGGHHHAETKLCAVCKLCFSLRVILQQQELHLKYYHDTCTDVTALMYRSHHQRL